MRRERMPHGPFRRLALVGTVLMMAVAPIVTAHAQEPAEPNCQFVPASSVGTTGDDYLAPEDADGVYQAYAGDDLMFGGPGTDIMCGARGNDEIHTGLGDDVLFPGYGVDDVFCGEGYDNVYEQRSLSNEESNYVNCESVVVLPF